MGVGVACTRLRSGYDHSVGQHYDFIATYPQSDHVTVPIGLHLKFANFRHGAAAGWAVRFFTQNGIQSHGGSPLGIGTIVVRCSLGFNR